MQTSPTSGHSVVMAKPDTSEAETITITRADLRKLIADEVSAASSLVAKGAADATVSVQRGLAGIQGQLATMEERTSVELGRPVPVRKPFPMLVQHCHHPRLGCDFDAFIRVREFDSEGVKLEKPEHTVTDLRITKWPEDLFERCKLPREAKEAGDGQGRHRRFSEKMDRRYSIAFLQWVATVYETPLKAELASGNDIGYLAPYVVGEPEPLDLGEVRRDASVGLKLAS